MKGGVLGELESYRIKTMKYFFTAVLVLLSSHQTRAETWNCEMSKVSVVGDRARALEPSRHSFVRLGDKVLHNFTADYVRFHEYDENENRIDNYQGTSESEEFDVIVDNRRGIFAVHNDVNWKALELNINTRKATLVTYSIGTTVEEAYPCEIICTYAEREKLKHCTNT